MHFATQAASPLTQVAGLDPLQLCRRLTGGQQGASRVLCCARPTEFQAGQPPHTQTASQRAHSQLQTLGKGAQGCPHGSQPHLGGRSPGVEMPRAGVGPCWRNAASPPTWAPGSVPSTRHPVHAAANELTRNPPPGQWRGLCEAPGAGAWPGAGTPRWSGLRLVGQVGPAVAANQPLPAGFSRNR